MIRFWYENDAIQIDGALPAPPRSLKAILDGDRVHVLTLSDFRLSQSVYSEYAKKDGTGFASAALLKAYLDGEFAKAPASSNTLLGTVTVAETATIAILAGVRKVTVAVPPAYGVVTGGNYLLFPTGATPVGYALADVVATAANTLQVTVTTPAIVLGGSYSIPCRLVRINT